MVMAMLTKYHQSVDHKGVGDAQKEPRLLLGPDAASVGGQVYTQTVPDGYVAGKAQPKPGGHVVVIARATIQNTRSRSDDSI